RSALADSGRTEELARPCTQSTGNGLRCLLGQRYRCEGSSSHRSLCEGSLSRGLSRLLSGRARYPAQSYQSLQRWLRSLLYLFAQSAAHSGTGTTDRTTTRSLAETIEGVTHHVFKSFKRSQR